VRLTDGRRLAFSSARGRFKNEAARHPGNAGTVRVFDAHLLQALEQRDLKRLVENGDNRLVNQRARR
jgi:hypothetical protein